MIATSPIIGAEASIQLFEVAGNPVPPGAILRRIRTPDGIQLRAARWESKRVWPMGTVVLLQGNSEFIEKYFEVIGELLERGFAVAAFDWRSQGGSGRMLADPGKSHVDDFSLYRHDLLAFLNDMIGPYCPKPWFALAHSMGAAVLAAAAHDVELPFERMVLCAPMLKINLGARAIYARLLAQTLDAMGFGGAYPPMREKTARRFRGLEHAFLTSDLDRFARTQAIKAAAPQIAMKGTTISWVNAALRFCAPFERAEYARDIRMPSLVFSCGDDLIVETATTDRFASRLKAGWHIPVPRARHELLMERDEFREQFWAAFDAFVPGTRDEVGAKVGRSAK